MSALFLVIEQLFIFGTAFDMWGNGSKSMLMVTLLQITCAAYTFLLASASRDSGSLSLMIRLRYLYFTVLGFLMVPVGLLAFLAFVALMQADQLASWTVSKNVLQYTGANLIPSMALAFFTIYLMQMRRYELENSDVQFDTDFHFGIKQAKRSNKSMLKSSNNESARQELERLLAVPESL